MKLMTILLLTLFAVSAIAQSVAAPVVVATIAPAVVAPVVATSGGVLAFIKANWGEVAFALSWILEGVFYFSPSIKANSFLEQVESWLKGQSVPPTL